MENKYMFQLENHTNWRFFVEIFVDSRFFPLLNKYVFLNHVLGDVHKAKYVFCKIWAPADQQK